MAIPVIMPKQGQSVETCIITGWFKKKGEAVSIGEILFSYETDKAAFDMESTAGGVLLEIFFEEGAEVPVLENVAVIGIEGEETEPFRPGKQSEKGDPSEKITSAGSPLTTSHVTHLPQNNEDGKVRISPRAKKLAEEKGVDYNNLEGTGPNGRIILDDIVLFLSNETAQPAARRLPPDTSFNDQPLSNVRKMIARAMHASLQNSAQLTHHMSADVRNILEARKIVKNNMEAGATEQDITLNDMICFCVVKALLKFPEANTHFLDDRIRTFKSVHLGIAVDTPRGLMVSVLRDADKMDIMKLSGELKNIVDACRKGNINPELLQSTAASFTVSNLGAYGVEMFTPVINLPQTGILGVCTIINRPADTGNGNSGFIPVIGLSLTYDHRAIDGGPATLFLKEIKKQIEGFRI
jgi:pyruvate dehydrogenase E2 component (dihydrolipoamide acetyltransferase)